MVQLDGEHVIDENLEDSFLRYDAQVVGASTLDAPLSYFHQRKVASLGKNNLLSLRVQKDHVTTVKDIGSLNPERDPSASGIEDFERDRR